MFTSADSETYILIAEDNPADIELVKEALHDRQVLCRLHIVSDGEQALSFIHQLDENEAISCPKLFLMDLHLPKRGGEEILSCLRSSERCLHTPVIVMTSVASRREMAATAQHANVHFFQKPTTLEQFMTLGDVVKDLVGTKDERL